MSVVQPPKAKEIPVVLEKHGHKRVDPFFWMKERESPEVIQYLEEQNTHWRQVLGDVENLQADLYREMRARIKEDDSSVPVYYKGYYYYTRFEEGQEYSFYARKKASLSAPEEILLNGPELAKGHGFFSMAAQRPSPSNDFLAFALDTVGRRQYSIYFKDLRSGSLLDSKIENTTGAVAWAADNKTVFFTRKDPETLRSCKIYRIHLDEPHKEVLVYEEKDEAFSVYVSLSKSEQYLFIQSESTESAETRYLSSNNPAGEFKIFHARKEKHEYSVDHLGSHFYILSNWNAKNFRILRCDDKASSQDHWMEFVAESKSALIDEFELFQDYLVVAETSEANARLKVVPLDLSQKPWLIEFPEPAYSANIGSNLDPSSKILRLQYSSLVSPATVYDYNMVQRVLEVKKVQPVLGGFNADDYVSERLWATAQDSTLIPISLVYKKGIRKPAPLILYGYGSYGLSMHPYFSSARLSFLDRGVIFAYAHIRGGQDMGREWYESGKLLKKKNTFNDFIDCADFLIQQGYTKSKYLGAWGGSAGGLLMGAVVNLRPELFSAVVASVPFVDVVTTMLDESIPLTTLEYDEWGNPNQEEFYRYMLSYSPYDNVQETKYPAMLIPTGFHDSQVQYWEPAKWAAKLQKNQKGSKPILLKTEMNAGHGGKSGRFEFLQETAWEYAFFLKYLTLSQQESIHEN